MERMGTALPAVEIPDDGDRAGMGRPDGEACARHPAHRNGVGAEVAVEAELPTLIEQVEVFLGQTAIAVGVWKG
jgi:hypothetical protein